MRFLVESHWYAHQIVPVFPIDQNVDRDDRVPERAEILSWIGQIAFQSLSEHLFSLVWPDRVEVLIHDEHVREELHPEQRPNEDEE